MDMTHYRTGSVGTGVREYVLGTDLRAIIRTSPAESDGRYDLVEGFQPAGAMTPLHMHTRYEERLFAVSGSMTVWVGDTEQTMHAGDFAVIPMNTPHTVRAGVDGCHALVVSSPAGFAALVARAGTPTREATAATRLNTELFTAVSEELGDRILGPPGMLPADLE
jgi:quercetin dioxygenase-like cupin family protein